MIRSRLFALALIASFGFGAGPGLAEGFLSRLADVPLMAGLAEDVQAGLVFDTIDGRVVEAQAGGRVKLAAARAYYREVLPELGWNVTEKSGDLLCRRPREHLTVHFQTKGAEAVDVHFTLKPDPKS
jgi:hypothetical protein